MVGATDLEKARMQIRWLKRDLREVYKKAWHKSERLKEIGDSSNVPKYFIDKYGLTEEAVNEAFFLGRQAGRLDFAESIIAIVGKEDE